MVLEEKTPDLLAMLTAHIEGNSLVVPVVPRPPMLAPPYPLPLRLPRRKESEGGNPRRKALRREKYHRPPNKHSAEEGPF